MNKKLKKLFTGFLVVTVLATTSYSVNASGYKMPGSIYEFKDTQYLASGVKHERIRKFTTSGWVNVNVVRVDMENQYTELKGLFNQSSIPSSGKISTMVDNQGAVAGVNGDYFNFAPVPSAMGTLISEGEMISSPIERAFALPTFYLDSKNEGHIDYLDRNITVTNIENKNVVIVNTLNKVTKDFTTPTLLNKNWGYKSIGTRYHKDLVELVVDGDTVTDVRIGQPAVDIPRNGYVVACRGDRAAALRNFKVGDKVELNVNTTPDIENIKFAIGGGSIILKDGEPTITNIHSSGYQPRTGIGVNKDNTELILVTVDGRNSRYKGLPQKTFGSLLKELGAYQGLNLDGGGSTTMAIKPVNKDKSVVANIPSGGSQRHVVNGVGVFSNAPKGELDHIEVSCSEPKMFKNTNRVISVKGYDAYKKPVDIKPSEIKLTIDGVEGSIENNRFLPTTSGNAVITAEYKGLKDSENIKVLGDIKNLYTKNTKLNIIPSKSYTLPEFYGQDKDGISARLYLEDVDLSIAGNIGSIKGKEFIASENPTNGIIVAKAGEGIENIKVTATSEAKIIEYIENIENFGHTKYPETVIGSVELSNNAKVGEKSLALKYDFTKGEGNRASYAMIHPKTKGMKLGKDASQLGLWVYGDNSNAWLRGHVVDGNNKAYSIDFAQNVDWEGWKYVNAELPYEATTELTLEKIYLVETKQENRQVGQILIDGLSAYYPKDSSGIQVDAPKPTILKDELERKVPVQEDGFNFIVYSESKDMDKRFEPGAVKKLQNRVNQSDIAISFNGYSDNFKSGLTNKSYLHAGGKFGVNKYKNAYFVNLDTRKGGIRNSGSDQWLTLQNDVMKREEKNIIVTLSSPVFGNNGFKDYMEADVFHNTMMDLKDKGKNVFVIQGGYANSKEIKDGIRYLSIDTRSDKYYGAIHNMNVVEFTVNGDDISYIQSTVFK